MYDAEHTNEELLARLRASVEVPNTTIEATGRLRGQWHDVVEKVEGLPEAFAYWAAQDDHQPAGYRFVAHASPDSDAMALDLKHLIGGAPPSLSHVQWPPPPHSGTHATGLGRHKD